MPLSHILIWRTILLRSECFVVCVCVCVLCVLHTVCSLFCGSCFFVIIAVCACCVSLECVCVWFLFACVCMYVCMCMCVCVCVCASVWWSPAAFMPMTPAILTFSMPCGTYTSQTSCKTFVISVFSRVLYLSDSLDGTHWFVCFFALYTLWHTWRC